MGRGTSKGEAKDVMKILNILMSNILSYQLTLKKMSKQESSDLHYYLDISFFQLLPAIFIYVFNFSYHGNIYQILTSF